MKERITEILSAQKGHIGFYYRNLTTGEEISYCGDAPFLAASVIKLPIYMCIEKWAKEGRVSLSETVKVREADKVPICGALTLFDGEPEVSIATLCRLMISLSDNTATNLLIRRFGIDAFREEFQKLGLKGTRLNRLLFDGKAAEAGIENTIVPSEMGMLLTQVAKGSFVDEAVSESIKDTLLLQQINHKICGIIGDCVQVAHKTGEYENLSNDVGIVYAKQPFVICFAGYDTDVPVFEDVIRHISYDVFTECNM